MPAHAAYLPPEIICEIALNSVLEDTVDRTWSALPLIKNTAWSQLEELPARMREACEPVMRDCLSSGFLERAICCSLSTDPTHAEETTDILAPEGLYHTVFNCMQVCRRWRHAVRGYAALWAEAGLLNPSFIYRSKALAGRFRPHLVNLRPLCACFIKHCIPVIASAEIIAFSTYALADANFTVSEAVLGELEAAAASREGCILQHLDLQLTCPEQSASLVKIDRIEIDGLTTARLTNTHFACYGRRLTRMELTCEKFEWKRRPDQILDLLSQCPALQHLSLVTSCKDMERGPLDRAWNPDVPKKLLLEELTCFILEDTTRECLKLLSSMLVSPDCDFHWTVIEPFGALMYSEGDLDVHLDFLRHIFDHMTEGAAISSTAVLEIVTDFGGYHHGRTRGIREWPEEMRVTFADSAESAMSQFVLRPGFLGPVLYRDLTRKVGQPRRSFAVRSQMLSTRPIYLETRYRPFEYRDSGNHVWIDVPLFESVWRTFITKMQLLKNFDRVKTFAVPRHAYLPHDYSTWVNFLSGLNITNLLLEGIKSTEQLEGLADHLATRRPHPDLASVWLPDIVSGDDQLSDEEIRDFMDPLLGNRRGCEQIAWSAQKFS